MIALSSKAKGFHHCLNISAAFGEFCAVFDGFVVREGGDESWYSLYTGLHVDRTHGERSTHNPDVEVQNFNPFSLVVTHPLMAKRKHWIGSRMLC